MLKPILCKDKNNSPRRAYEVKLKKGVEITLYKRTTGANKGKDNDDFSM